MYDPALGRDTIIPPGPQGLDRYAYVNNAPVMYVDPSGHFTQTAIYNYLYRQCLGGGDKNDDKVNARAEKCASSTMTTWQADKDWWRMIINAEEGDTIFGLTENGNIATATFTGVGATSLNGVDVKLFNEWSLPSTSLEDIQQGNLIAIGARASRITIKYTWHGLLLRPAEGSVPLIYIRPGYGQSNRGDVNQVGQELLGDFAGAYVGIFIACSGGNVFLLAACALGGGKATSLIMDGLDAQAGDFWVATGPLYFNFNLDYSGGNATYTLEHINLQTRYCQYHNCH